MDLEPADLRVRLLQRGRILAAALLLGLVWLASWWFGGVFADRASQALQRQAVAEADFRAAMLGRYLEQFRDVPRILAQDPDIRAAVRADPKSAIAQSLNLKLEALIDKTEAQAIYLIGPDGVTRAASNWRETRSFVGQDYQFRPYFTRAQDHGASEFFAVGTVTAEPGLYIAHRVEAPTGQPGVIVVKVHLDSVEAEWARLAGQVAVLDPHGIVILSSAPQWRFRPTRPLSAQEIRAMTESKQFGAAPNLAVLPLTTPDEAESVASANVAGAPWSLLLRLSRAPVATAQRSGQAIGALATALVGLILAFLWNARRRFLQQRLREERARQDLEARVRARTQELHDANLRLSAEMAERRRAETNAETLQDELIQANRLAVVGQISAGVAHEINQPLAAIRAFADNGVSFLDRGDSGEARANLSAIGDLATRISTITDELRSMSRKSRAPREIVPVSKAIDGALLLIGPRARSLDIRIERADAPSALNVLAHRMRLEQVLLNLLQNALDACHDRPDSVIRISSFAAGGEIHVEVADNGPGLSESATAALFQPFNTTKPQGVGLGLVISQDICREYGGRLEVVGSALGGAAFRITLPAAS